MKNYKLLPLYLIIALTSATQGFNASAADEIFRAYNKTFWDANTSQFREQSDSPEIESNFWMAAEEFEMLLDVYEYSKKPDVLKQCIAYYDGFTSAQRYGTDWLTLNPAGKYNDDMIWVTIATLRLYQFTGNTRYKEQAKKTFDGVWQRGWDNKLGGGIHWSTDNNGKNSCINFPAGIAAVMLSEAFQDPNYLRKAEQIYHWARENLVDETNASVWDHKTLDDAVGKVCLTYNQGTYIGLAHLLYKKTSNRSYYNDANSAMVYAQKNFCHTGTNILFNEDFCKDALGFKGIFIRYASKFAGEYKLSKYINWLKENAKAVYNNRRNDGLTYTNFNFKCPDGPIAAWGATPGVIIMHTTAQ